MNKQSIAVIDSGIGGISVLKNLTQKFPTEHFIYFGDNDNAPYGNLSKLKLLQLAMRSIDFVKSYNVKAVVLACNTLSVNLFNEINEYSNIPTFCVFPPVEQCEVSGQKTLLLATDRTAKNYKTSKYLDVVGLKDLASIIEKNVLNLDRFDFNEYFNFVVKKNDLTSNYANVILGCTHFNFIKNQIFVHFRPQNLCDGTENLLINLQKFYKNDKSLDKYKRFYPLFIGKNGKLNEYIYNVSGQSISFWAKKLKKN